MTGRWIGASLLLALVLAAYLPALGGGFIWDDDDYVSENPMLRSSEGLRRIWTDPSATPQYYPLTHTTFWIEYRLWGLRPAGYHAVNVLLHAVCAILLWTILRRLRVPGAWLGSVIFALHPIQVESVAWITERKNVLSGAFYLAALLVYLRFAGTGDSRADDRCRGSWTTYSAALALFVAALVSKTVTATLPATLALILWWKRGRLDRRSLLPLVPMVAVGAVFGGLTAWLERVQIGASGAEWSLSSLERVLLAGRAVWFYLGKLLWPVNLTFIYPRWTIRADEPIAYLYPVALAGLFVVLWAFRHRLGRGPFAAMAYFVVALVPALGFVNVYPMRYSFVADHFQYLAGIGPLVLVAAGIWLGTTALLANRGETSVQWLRMATTSVLVVVLGLATASQARIYESLEVLWRDTLAKNPAAWAAHNNLGAMLGEWGELDEAATHLERAVVLKPDHAGAWANLGVVRARQGRIEDAVRSFRRAIGVDPEDRDTLMLLGEALGRAGRPHESEEYLSRAVELDPGDARARHLLGNALVAQSRFEDAVEHYRAALEKWPDDFSTNLNLGSALARMGREEEALTFLDRAVRIEPDNVQALLSLGSALLSLDRPEEAAVPLREAVAIDPSNAPARRALERAVSP